MKPDELLDQASLLDAGSDGEGDGALQSITGLTVAVIDGCDAASLSVTGAGGVTTRAASGPLATALDEIQYRTGEGPSLDAISTGALSRPTPPAGETRWPRFWSESRAEGLQGTLSAPVRVEQRVVGSLNLYARSSPFDLTEQDELLGVLLASHAAMALAAERAAERHAAVVDQLNQALASRDLIGQAKGILMAREGCNSDQAFDMLRRASQRLNQKLREVAEGIIQSAQTGKSGPPRSG
jgi:GAF domain-containing protein